MFNLFCPQREGKTLVFLNGQSNANTFQFSAIKDCLISEPPDNGYSTGHFWRSGNQISLWMNEKREKGRNWEPMMAEYRKKIDECNDSGEVIGDIHLVYWQGEADTQNPATFEALENGTSSIFVEKLSNWIEVFTNEITNYSSVRPTISLALVGYDREHPIFKNAENKGTISDESVDMIRKEISDVASSYSWVNTFETRDLGRRDHVHVNHYPKEGLEMKVAAERALSFIK